MERSLIMLNKKKIFTNLFTNLIQNNTGSVHKSWYKDVYDQPNFTKDMSKILKP